MNKEILRQMTKSRKKFQPVGGLPLDNESQTNTELNTSSYPHSLLIGLDTLNSLEVSHLEMSEM